MIKDYEINQHNSTVCGYPGRNYDWCLFGWQGKETHSGFCIEKPQLAPKPWVDDGFIREGSQYLHVPYDWIEQGTIYRVRPNECMRAGSTYRGKRVKRQTAIKKRGRWYWRLEFEG